ncbi:hypothetical protein LCGC14_2004350 [marine sediment metagenome]|uniref:Uncharacterized protein n=1 Tax=marine sediment metagenome TaxID=412755 RepID=A0A0F9F2B1_9ZZZZ
MRHDDQAFIDAYAGVEIRLPNRPLIRCRPLTVAAVAGLLPLIRRHAGGEKEAFYELMYLLPRFMWAPLRVWTPLERLRYWWSTRASRRIVARLRGVEALRVVERVLGADSVGDTDTKTGPGKVIKTLSEVNLLDHLSDFENAYGYQPDPEMSWALFTAGVERAQRYTARHLLNQMVGTQWAIGSAFGGSGTSKIEQKRITDLAYPSRGNNGAMPEGAIVLVDDPADIDKVLRQRPQDKVSE